MPDPHELYQLDEDLPDLGRPVLIQALTGFLNVVRHSPDRWHCIVVPMPDMPTEFHAAREQARAIVLQQAQQVAARMLGDHGTDAELAAHAVVTLFEMAAQLLLTSLGVRRTAGRTS